MRLVIASFAVLVVSLGEACPPSPSPPGPDASDSGTVPTVIDAGSTPNGLACARLAALGCKEGVASNCVATLDHVAATHHTYIDVACIAGAASKAAVRACAGASCE